MLPAAWWASLGLIALLAVGNSLIFGSSNHIDDDAFIFFRYADNLLDGHGLTWNPGPEHERVEGYTSFVYVMLLAALRSTGADPVTIAHVLNILLFAAMIVLSGWLIQRLTGRRDPSLLLVPLLIATSSQFVAWARNGMETTLFAVLLVIAIGMYVRQSAGAVGRIVTGAVFGLLILTRPEAPLAYIACLMFTLLTNRSVGKSLLGRDDLLCFVALACVVGVHLVWRVAYYGEWLPNTYYAKVGFSSQVVTRGIKGLLTYLGTFHGALAVVGLVLCAALPKQPRRLLPILLLGIWMAYITFTLGLPAWGMAYTMPISLFALIVFGWAAADLLDVARNRGESIWSTFLAPAACLLLVLIGNLSSLATPLFDPNRKFSFAIMDPPDNQVVNNFIVIGKELKRIALPDDTLAVGACGAIPYYSGLVTYDALGLNDKHIARMPMPATRTDAFGHEKGDGRYILDKKPTFLIPLPILTPGPNPNPAGFEISFNEIFRMPEFRRDYEFKNLQLLDGRVFNYYQRRGAGVVSPTAKP